MSTELAASELPVSEAKLMLSDQTLECVLFSCSSSLPLRPHTEESVGDTAYKGPVLDLDELNMLRSSGILA